MTIDEVIASIEKDIRANEAIIDNLKTGTYYMQDADERLNDAIDIRTLEHIINAYRNCLRRIKQVNDEEDNR